MSYLWRDEHTIVANHTWVDDSLRGQGVARVLLDTFGGLRSRETLKNYSNLFLCRT